MGKRQLNRWVRLIACVLVMMFSGIVYAWSNIMTPLVQFGWSDSALTFNYTLSIWCFCIGGLLSGLFSKKISPRLRMIVSACLIAFGFWLVSRLPEGSSIFLLYLGYALLAGSGIGVVYNTVIVTISGWFPDKKGICSGALMMGFGLSSFFIGLISGRVLQSGSMDWRNLYLALGLSSGIVVFFGSFLLCAPDQVPGAPAARNSFGLTPLQTIKRSSFWKIFLYFILLSAVGSCAIAFARSFTMELGIPEAIAVVIASVVSIFNSLGRLASGAIVDRFGLNKTKYITSAVAITAPLLALLGILFGSAVLGALGLLMCGFCYGFNPTVSAAFTLEFYGPRDYAANLSLINLVLIPGAFVPTLGSALLVALGGSYVPVFSLLIGFSVLGLVLNLFIKEV